MALTTIVYWLHLSHLKKKNTENRQNSGSTLNRVFCSTLKDFKDFKDVVECRDSAELSSRTRGWRHQLTILVARNLFPESRTSLLTKNREPTMFHDDLSVKVGTTSIFSMYRFKSCPKASTSWLRFVSFSFCWTYNPPRFGGDEGFLKTEDNR